MRTRTVLALLGALTSLGATASAQDAGEPAKAKVLDVRAKVLDLNRKVTSQGGAVARTDRQRQVRVGLAADVLFAFNSAKLTGGARRALREAAEAVRDEAGGVVTIEGHTDDRGDPEFNRRLSLRRARAVERALVRLAPDARFRVRGRGEADPVAPNKTKDGKDNPRGRKLNRRVEVRFARR